VGKPRVNYRASTKKAKAFVLANQVADFKSVRAALGGAGVGTVKEVLKRLKVQGVVGQGKRRHWVVLMNPDGTKKEGVEVVKVRRRKIRRPRKLAAAPVESAAPPAAAKSQAKSAPHAKAQRPFGTPTIRMRIAEAKKSKAKPHAAPKANGAISAGEKLELLYQMAELFEGHKAEVFKAITSDVEESELSRQVRAVYR